MIRIWLSVMLALLLSVLGMAVHLRHQAQALASVRLARDQALAVSRQTARSLQLERAHAQAAERAAHQYEEDRIHAMASARGLEADLRAARLRLRRPWRCAPAGAVPAVDPATGGADASTDDRAASAAHLVRAAEEADAQVRALQAYIRSQQWLPREGTRP